MNYYNPYYFIPMSRMARPSLFGVLRNSFRGINFGGILNGTQRTLNIINQAIPIVKQVRPVMKNARTMFNVINQFKKVDEPNNLEKTNNKNAHTNSIDNSKVNKPSFFI